MTLRGGGTRPKAEPDELWGVLVVGGSGTVGTSKLHEAALALASAWALSTLRTVSCVADTMNWKKATSEFRCKQLLLQWTCAFGATFAPSWQLACSKPSFLRILERLQGQLRLPHWMPPLQQVHCLTHHLVVFGHLASKKFCAFVVSSAREAKLLPRKFVLAMFPQGVVECDKRKLPKLSYAIY